MKIHAFPSPSRHDSQPSQSLVFLHGGNVAGWMWGQQVPDFSEYDILVPDLPGFGESNHLPWMSIDDTADAVADAIPDNSHLVGLSLGSSIAVHLAARHPHKVASLFLASAQVAPPSRRDVAVGRLMLLMWNQKSFWRSLARSYGLRGDDAELFISTGLGIESSTARAIFAEVAQGISTDVLERVTVPTVSIAGGADSAAIAGVSLDLVASVLPDSLTATAPGLHHQWNIEGVELFNSAVHEWLDGRSLAAGLHRAPRTGNTAAAPRSAPTTPAT